MTRMLCRRMFGYADIARRIGDIGPTPEMGEGFDLGFAVRATEGQCLPAPGCPLGLNENVFRACQWHDRSLKHGGPVAMSAVPTPVSRSGPERVCAPSQPDHNQSEFWS
jgi:hypothetical protein